MENSKCYNPNALKHPALSTKQSSSPEHNGRYANIEALDSKEGLSTQKDSISKSKMTPNSDIYEIDDFLPQPTNNIYNDHLTSQREVSQTPKLNQDLETKQGNLTFFHLNIIFINDLF